jgi:hypothetical protein
VRDHRAARRGDVAEPGEARDAAAGTGVR